VCNEYDAVCLESKIKYPSSFPISQAVTSRPDECVSAGAFWHPETAVLAAAQPPVAAVVLLGALLCTFAGCRGKLSKFAWVMSISIFINALLLLISYFYLHGFLAVMITCIALTCYSTRDNVLVAAGMFGIFFVLLFFTFEPGLGSITHHSRLMVGLSDNTENPYYETLCSQYYRSYFWVDPITRRESEDPKVVTYGYCNRAWLAAEYAFVIFMKIQLILLVAAGARTIRPRPEPKPINVQ
jgi:hypothetical protein